MHSRESKRWDYKNKKKRKPKSYNNELLKFVYMSRAGDFSCNTPKVVATAEQCHQRLLLLDTSCTLRANFVVRTRRWPSRRNGRKKRKPNASPTCCRARTTLCRHFLPNTTPTSWEHGARHRSRHHLWALLLTYGASVMWVRSVGDCALHA